MENQIIKILLAIVYGVVACAVSYALFDVLNTTIDNAIISSGESVSWLLQAMKFFFSMLAYDGVSFAIGILTSVLSIFKYVKTKE